MRSRCLSPIALALAIVAAPALTHAEPLTVGKAIATASVMLPADLGVEFGIFKKRGLDVKIVDFTGGTKLFQAMVGGSVDIGLATGNGMAFTAKGAPFVAICENEAKMFPTGIAVPWDSPVHDLDGLKGKRIGVSGAGSFTDWLATQLAKQRGWGPDGVTNVSVGNDMASGVAGFRTNAIDADIFSTADIFAMEERHEGRLLADAADFTGPMAAGAMFATKQAIANRPEDIRAFLAGWLETIDFMRQHKDTTVDAESKLSGFSPAVMARDYDLVIASFNKGCGFDAESLANLKAQLIDQKLLGDDADMSTLYTDALMPK
ncbi:MAG TPA: ABC transporter substrate-binding protein [Stellaceae bacterium]|jgi:ABC-type nitrate/sulfonate/bicarbonate transport system substrate-binding protein|nr:ABC transporter substrate-binding protein [Stellaceae bacterium]